MLDADSMLDASAGKNSPFKITAAFDPIHVADASSQSPLKT